MHKYKSWESLPMKSEKHRNTKRRNKKIIAISGKDSYHYKQTVTKQLKRKKNEPKMSSNSNTIDNKCQTCGIVPENGRLFHGDNDQMLCVPCILATTVRCFRFSSFISTSPVYRLLWFRLRLRKVTQSNQTQRMWQRNQTRPTMLSKCVHTKQWDAIGHFHRYLELIRMPKSANIARYHVRALNWKCGSNRFIFVPI